MELPRISSPRNSVRCRMNEDERCRDDVSINRVSELDAAAIQRPSAGKHAISDQQFPPLASFCSMCLGWCIRTSAFTIVIPTADSYATSLGASRVFSGLLIGIFPLMSVIAQFIFDRLGKKYSLNIGMQISYVTMILGSVLYALAMLTRSPWTLLVARGIQVCI